MITQAHLAKNTTSIRQLLSTSDKDNSQEKVGIALQREQLHLLNVHWEKMAEACPANLDLLNDPSFLSTNRLLALMGPCAELATATVLPAQGVLDR